MSWQYTQQAYGLTTLATPYVSASWTISMLVPENIARVEAPPNLRIGSGFVISCPNLMKEARVLHPFSIKIQPVAEGFIATSDISDVYELGETRQQATLNYLYSLVDEIVWFQDNEERLSQHMLEDYKRLQFYVGLV